MASRKEKPLLSWVQDTREQTPYEFHAPKRREFEDGGTVCYGLDAGDYSCEVNGELLPIRVERKTISDYFGVVGRGRERFERELERLKAYTAFLVIEATAEEIRHGCERSLVSGEAAYASALCWNVKAGISVIFAGNRRTGRDTVQRLLEEFAVHNYLKQ